jgi:uncharacterized LabA/DUF88 family protein
MMKEGHRPREGISHIPDVVVWSSAFTDLAKFHEILRVTYYTYVVGDDAKVRSVREYIRQLNFMKHDASLLPNFLTPCVFKKESRERKAKGVDIQICVDILIHVYRHNTDAILLLSGDGDYEPLIDEVLRNGVQVFLSAFSKGLNPRLRDKVDQLYELDGTTWQ